MTKDELLNRFLFSNKNEESEAHFYLDMKGIAIHEKIAIYLGLDLKNKKQQIEWNKVSSLLRYDKKLRDKIYIYLATLEEYVRAYISNKYEDNPGREFWINGNTKRLQIKNRIHNGERVSVVLESIDFNGLMQQVLKLPCNDINDLFDNFIDISTNLNAVRELRNAVSHHAFLMGHNLKKCVLDGISSNSLDHNIKNLRQLLPNQYRYGDNGNGGITAEIEDCRFEQRDSRVSLKEKTEMCLDKRDVIYMK